MAVKTSKWQRTPGMMWEKKEALPVTSKRAKAKELLAKGKRLELGQILSLLSKYGCPIAQVEPWTYILKIGGKEQIKLCWNGKEPAFIFITDSEGISRESDLTGALWLLDRLKKENRL